ncbi:MAG: xanthine dehydrogenase accessory protein XdhC [Planctomycetes bacterium]|nr:xanthine dehydrogenase accessory protein XdhC [Planctomycetota bacterium]
MRDWNLMEVMLDLRRTGTPFVETTLVEARGSTPADAGSRMIVTADGLLAGTVGGGRIEAKAIEFAQRMLADRAVPTQCVEWNLKNDVGMTCGGVVRVYFEASNLLDWKIVIFGAGHVTQALARLLVTMPCMVRCIDPRGEWLERLPAGVARTRTDDPPGEVEKLSDDCFVLCMTRGHKSDLPVLVEIFRENRVFAYLGVIGSASKAAVLRREIGEAGVPAQRVQFHCPIGLPIGSNHPSEIAVSIAAQLLEVRGRGIGRGSVDA